MPAPEGNKNRSYSTEQMSVLVDQFCDHISKGYSKESFPHCDYRTIETHLQNDVELQSKKAQIEEAYRLCRLHWEKVGMKLSIKGEGNAAAWIFNMKNRFAHEWRDKQELEHSGQMVNINLRTMEECEPLEMNADDIDLD